MRIQGGIVNWIYNSKLNGLFVYRLFGVVVILYKQAG